jgi:replicative DNA helicase
MPHDLDAERAVLGVCLLDEKGVWAATECLQAEDFYLEAHRIIFERMAGLAAAGKAIDIFTLRAELARQEGEEDKAGGVVYLNKLTDGFPRGANVRHYAAIVKGKATRRMLIRLCAATAQKCYGTGDGETEILEGHEAELFKLAAHSIAGGFETAGITIDRVYQEMEEVCNRKASVTGISSGFKELDRMTAGFHRSELAIIAGRPGLGKTSFCSTVALHAARHGRSVGIVSLEMSRDELTRRHLANEAEVDYHKIRTGFLGKDEWGRISRAAGEISSWKLHVDDAGDLTTLQLRARAQRLALEKGLELLIIDYLQLLRGSGKRYENRTHEVTDISRSLKALAKELKIPVLAATQLNRAVDQGGRKPRLADLRESGSIEQDADLVLFLSRPEGSQEGDAQADITIGKQRNGATGTIRLAFIKQYMKFADLWKDQ